MVVGACLARGGVDRGELLHAVDAIARHHIECHLCVCVCVCAWGLVSISELGGKPVYPSEPARVVREFSALVD